MVVSGGNDLTTGLTGIPGLMVLLVVNIILLFHTPTEDEYARALDKSHGR